MSAITEFQQDIVLLDGKFWQRSHCELHFQYQEFVIWLKTHSLEQTKECPRYLLAIYDNYSHAIDGINISTLIYLNNKTHYHIYPLDRTEALLAVGSGSQPFDEADYFKQSFKNVSLFK